MSSKIYVLMFILFVVFICAFLSFLVSSSLSGGIIKFNEGGRLIRFLVLFFWSEDYFFSYYYSIIKLNFIKNIKGF